MSEELARKLKEARALLGLSQAQAAKAWQIPRQTLISWEHDRYTPRGFALAAINEKLDAILAGPPAAPARKAAGKKAQ